MRLISPPPKSLRRLGFSLAVFTTALLSVGALTADIPPLAADPSVTFGAALHERPWAASAPNRQPLSSSLLLPALVKQEPADYAPVPAAPLGQAIRDIAWLDGLLYAAMESHVVSFREADGRLRPVDVSVALPGIVYDLEAVGGVIYAAHLSVPAWPSHAVAGGLTVLASGEAGELRTLTRVILDGTDGYVALAATNGALAAVRCSAQSSFEISCTFIDALDITDPARPRLRGSVRSTSSTSVPPILPALATLPGERITDGDRVVDLAGDGPPMVVDWLPSPGKPVAEGEWLVTYGDIGDLHLYRTDPQTITAQDDLINGDSRAPVTAAAFASGGVMLSSPLDASITGKPDGGWLWVPVSADGFGKLVGRTTDIIDRALSVHNGVLWRAMSAGVLDDPGLSPFRPSIRSQPTEDGAPPSAPMSDLWTGWTWETLDMWVEGARAYVLVQDPLSASNPAAVDLLVYDVTDPRVPTLIGRTPMEVCTVHSSFYEACSVVAIGPERLLVSGTEGASEVTVADPSHPAVVRSGPSLGLQLTLVPEGLLALRGVNDISTDPALVLYDPSGSWPVEMWAVPTRMDPYKLAADSSTGRTLVALIDAYEYPPRIEAGWISGPDSPPTLLLKEHDRSGGLTWMPPSLVASGDSIIVADIFADRADARIGSAPDGALAPGSAQDQMPSGSRQGDDLPSLISYRVSDTGIDASWSVPLMAEYALGRAAAIINERLLLGHRYSLESFALASDGPPSPLGVIPYADGANSSVYFEDETFWPTLVAVGDRHVYVIGHPVGQVMELPPLR